MTPAPFDAGLKRSEALRAAAGVLAGAGIEAPLREARLLLLAATGMTPEALILTEGEALGPDAARFSAYVARRAGREPFARITGQREFFGHRFTLAPATLVPRPDTEILVEAVLEEAAARQMGARAITIADLGTGSGAILAALLHALPQASGIAIDISQEALATAAGNIEAIAGPGRLSLIHNDWLGGLSLACDILVSNPPYIPAGDIAALEAEVARGDPRVALDGGADGLDAYRALADTAGDALAPGGFIGLEIGAGQADAVTALFSAAGFEPLARRLDLGGHIRALTFAKG